MPSQRNETGYIGVPHCLTMDQPSPLYMGQLHLVEDRIAERPATYLIGIAGIPGSGKSTFATALCKALPGAVVLPMDGYHIPRSRLDAEGMRRRGAAWTFDHQRLRHDLTQLKNDRAGCFPNFDHATKDPHEGAITITKEHRVVIVEGLYLLMKDWNLGSLFNLTMFIDCDLDVAMQRLAKRHVECGLEPDLPSAWRRIERNDLLNANAILHDGGINRADVIVSTTPTEF